MDFYSLQHKSSEQPTVGPTTGAASQSLPALCRQGPSSNRQSGGVSGRVEKAPLGEFLRYQQRQEPFFQAVLGWAPRIPGTDCGF